MGKSVSMKYKCGHESDGAIFLDDNELSLIAYTEWSESVGIFGTKKQCWDCFCEGEE